MSRPSILTRVRLCGTAHEERYKPVRLFVDDHDPAFVPLVMWECAGGLLGELALTEDERLDLIRHLAAVGRSSRPACDEEEVE